MKPIRIIGPLFAVAVGAAAFAADPIDPTGTWKWSTRSPDGEIPTTLKLEWKNGKIAGAYSNQFGGTAIRNASIQDGVIRFDVVRDLGGRKYVVKYHGKIEGDTIHGTIEAPGHDGGEAVKLDWNAKRTTKEKAGGASLESFSPNPKNLSRELNADATMSSPFAIQLRMDFYIPSPSAATLYESVDLKEAFPKGFHIAAWTMSRLCYDTAIFSGSSRSEAAKDHKVNGDGKFNFNIGYKF